jgi:hypothetical protein
VVPDTALSTTIFGSASEVINLATSCIRSGLPTEVPPNFIIFIATIIYSGAKIAEQSF